MKTKLCVGILLLAAALLRAQTNDLTNLLQQGLFEEQANRNFDAAIADYQALAKQFDKDRQLAATAVFRLGECYRAQGRTNEATAQYQRILRDFSDQQTLATLSRQDLAGMGAQPEPGATDARRQQRALLDKQIALAEQDLADTQRLVQTGQATALEARAAEKEVLRLRQQLAALDANQGDLMNLPVQAGSEDDQEIARIEKLLQTSPDLINKKDNHDNTLLAKAAVQGQMTVVNYLLDHGADVNAGNPALYQAAGTGNRAMVELLLQRGANVNADYGDTALGKAAEEGFVSIVELLLAHNANPNVADSWNNQTPLFKAVYKGQEKCARLLLGHGADPSIASKVHGSLPPGKVDGRNIFGTPLHIAAARGDAEMVALLLTNRADVKALNVYSETPLQVAAASGHADVAELLLSAGADPNALGNSEDGTPLHMAAAGGYQDVVQRLLAHGANPNSTVRQATPLMVAAYDGYDEIARLLLERNAETELKDSNGDTALARAVNANQTAAVKVLLAHGANPNVWNGGYSVLLQAVREDRNADIVKALVDAKADVNAVAGDEQYSALHLAAGRGSREVAQILLAAHADVNLREQNGQTPLHLAVRGGWDPIARLLLDAGADPNMRDNSGVTPLDLAKNLGKGSPRPGLGLGSPGRLSLPRGVPFNQGPGERQAEANTTNTLADLLRQHGALDNLPDWDRISVSRPSAKYSQPVFYKSTNGWNQITLFDVLGVQYDLLTSAWGGVPRSRQTEYDGSEVDSSRAYPDFRRIIIHHPPASGVNWSEVKVDLSHALESSDCAADVPLQFGDVVEIPEADHIINERWPGLSTNELFTLKSCLTRHLQITVNGQKSGLTISPALEEVKPGMPGYRGIPVNGPAKPQISLLKYEPCMLWPVLNYSKLLLASSDLSRVQVKRRDPATGKIYEWTLDCSKPDMPPNFWVRDGDVIEVP